MNRSFSKTVTAFALALCFLFIELSPLGSVSFAANSVPAEVFDPVTLGVPLFNNVTLGDFTQNGKTYFDTFSKSEPIGLTYNIANLLKSNGSWLGYFVSYKRLSGTYSFALSPALDQLRKDGQLMGMIHAELTNDLHGSWNHAFSKKLAAQYITLDNGYKRMATYNAAKDHKDDGTWGYGYINSNLTALSTDASANTLTMKIGNTVCADGCGTCKVSNFFFVLADRQNPYITGLKTTSDAEGTIEKHDFKAGQRVYLHLTFNEYIRFAANAKPNTLPELALLIKDNSTGATVTDVNVHAKLYALKEKNLSFWFDVPQEVNHTVIGISPDVSRQTGLFSSTNTFDLAQVNGAGVTIPHGFSQTELLKTTSLITDIAGNPATLGNSVTSFANGSTVGTDGKTTYRREDDKRCRIDAVVPTVQKITVESNSGAAAGTGRAVNAGVGETLTFKAYFSEQLDSACLGTLANIQAEINILDTSNESNPVKLNAAGVTTETIGVNATEPVTVITFDTLTLTDTMISANYDHGVSRGGYNAYLPIGVNKITFAGGGRDYAQNAYAEAQYVNAEQGRRLMPDTQLWLDTQAPEASLASETRFAEDDSEKIVPDFPASANNRYFRIHVIPADEAQNDTKGHSYASGIFDAYGSFRLGEFSGTTNQPTEQYDFEYAVTASQNPPANWEGGKTGVGANEASGKIDFKQIGASSGGGGNYIHIRLREDVPYNFNQPALILTATDFAGNTGKAEWKLAVDMDSEGPTAAETSHYTTFDTTPGENEGKGKIHVNVKVYDPRGVDTGELYYKWSDTDVTPAYPTIGNHQDGGWVKIMADSFEAITGDLVCDTRVETSEYTRYLFVAAADNSTKHNQAVIPLGAYVMKMALPRLTITPTVGFTASPQIALEKPRPIRSTGSPTYYDRGDAVQVYTMIEDEANPGHWFVCQTTDYAMGTTNDTYSRTYWHAIVNKDTYNYVVSSENVYIENGDEFQWSYAAVSEGSGVYTFSDVTPFSADFTTNTVTADGLEAGVVARMNAIFNNAYYGDLNVQMVYGLAKHIQDTSGDDYQERSKVAPLNDASQIRSGDIVLKEQYTLYARPGEFTASSSKFGSTPAASHSITIQPVTKDGEAEVTSDAHMLVCGEYSGTDDDAARYVNSLAEGAIRVDVINNADESIGVTDILWNSPNTYARLFWAYENPHSDSPTWYTEYVKTWTLSAASSQLLTLTPAESNALQSSRFKLEVSVQPAVGAAITKEFTDIYLHNIPLPEFGAAGVESEFRYSNTTTTPNVSMTRTYTDMPGYHAVKNADGKHNNVSALYMGGSAGSESVLYFTAKNAQTGKLFSGATSFALRIWNETAHQPQNGAAWKPMTGSVGADGNCVLGIPAADLQLQSGENTIKYQLRDGNRTVSPVKTLTVRCSTAAPTLKMSFSPDQAYVEATDLVKEAFVVPESLQSGSDTPIQGLYRVVNTSNQSADVALPGYTEALQADGVYTYYAYDRYGNFAADTIDIKDIIEGGVPVIENYRSVRTADEEDNSPSRNSNILHFKAEITEDRLDKGLTISYKPELTGGLSYVDGYNGDWIELPVQIPRTVGDTFVYTTKQPENGLYFASVTRTDADKVEVEVKAGCPTTHPSQVSMYSQDVTLKVEDKVGNRAEDTKDMQIIGLATATGDTRIPAVVKEANGTLMMAVVGCATPYMMANAEEETVGAYSAWKPLYLYEKLTDTKRYEIVNAMGKSFLVDLDKDAVNALIGAYEMKVTRSETRPTKGPVTVDVDISGNQELASLEITGINSDRASYTVSADNKHATLTVSANTTFSVKLTRTNNEWRSVPITIDNIDNTAPQGTLYWHFSEWGITCTDGEKAAALGDKDSTTGSVTAWVEADEDINDITGGGISYTFIPGEDTSHTFTYQDAAGNEGNTLTARLPVTMSAPVVEGNPPLSYSVDISMLQNGVYTPCGSFDPDFTQPGRGSLDACIANCEASAGLKLTFAVSAPSGYRLLLSAGDGTEKSYNTGTDTITGVQIVGNAVLINDNRDFTVVLADAKGNQPERIQVSVNKIDTEPPEVVGQPEVENVGFYAKRVIVKVNDNTDPNNVGKTIRAKDASQGFVMQTDGRFARTFTQNGTYPFDFVDKNGVEGHAEILVDSIDDVTATATVLGWSPGKPGSEVGDPDNNKDDPVRFEQPTEGPVNTDVSVFLRFDKDVVISSDGSALIYRTHGSGNVPPDKAVVTQQNSTHATITFKESGFDVTLRYRSLNTLEGSFDNRDNPGQYKHLGLAAGVIDKTSPTLTVTTEPDDPDNDASAQVKFTINADEDIMVRDAGTKQYKAVRSVNKIVTKNGDYSFSFADRAGNVSEVKGTLTKIDSTPPIIVLGGVEAQAGGKAKISASLSEAGRLMLVDYAEAETLEQIAASTPDDDDRWEPIHAPSETAVGAPADFLVSQNGRYCLIGKDNVGWLTFATVAVECVDKISPTISLNPVTVSIAKGSAASELNTLLQGSVTVTDNKPEAPTLTIDTSNVDLGVAGEYSVKYTAEDGAHNKRTVTGYVRVYDGSEPEISANGVKLYSQYTTVLTGTRAVNFTVSNLRTANEPYSIYAAAGKKTEGQMKSAQKITGNPYTFPSNGLYTVLLVTQSRASFLTYLYIQQ